MADILLIMPRIGYMDSKRSKPAIPLSLLSAVRVACREFSVKLIDIRISKDYKSEIISELNKKPLLVATTCWTGPMIRDVIDVLKIVKSSSNVPTVVGGVHPSLLPSQTIEDRLIDFVIEGEGEEAFYRLVKYIKYGGSIEDIPALWYKDGTTVKHNKKGPLLDLGNLPDLSYEILNIEDYLPLYSGRKSISFESSRGCPFACRYCYQGPFNNRIIRFMPADEVVRRLENIHKRYGVEDIYFIDDNFYIDLERGRAIAEGLRDLGLTYQVQGVDVLSLMRMDSGYLRLLEESGLRRITIGVETGSERLRKYLNKKGSINDIVDVIRRLSSYNIIVYCSFFGGYPEEKIEDIEKSVELILKLIEINPNFRCSPYYIYIPFPGTPMFEEMVGNGFFKPPENFRGWGEFSWESNPYIYTQGKEKAELYRRLYFLTLFADSKFKEYETNYIIKTLSSIYGIIARYRLKKFNFKFMPEMSLYKLILRL
jgi:radical SAM superfamily enzyme YgiQ (UPF0313 family)